MTNAGLFLGLLFLIAASTAVPYNNNNNFLETASGIEWQDNVRGYPETIADELLAELERRQIKLSLSNDQFLYLSQSQKFQDDNKNYTNLCSSTIRVMNPKNIESLFRVLTFHSNVVLMSDHTALRKIFPQGVKIYNEEYYVLNPKSRPLQFIETEICNHGTERKTCEHVESAQVTYTTECKQEYIKRTVYLMPKNNHRNLTMRPVIIESCCSCFIKQLN